MANRGSRGGPHRPPPRRGLSAYRRQKLEPPPVNGFSASLISPVSGFSTPDRTPTITVVGNSVLLSPVDIQVEWRRQEATFNGSVWSPAPIYTNTVIGAVSGTPQSIEPPNPLDYKTWWYRARAGSTEFNQWSSWTAQKWLDVRPVLGSVAQYIDLNVGVTDPPLSGTFAYIDLNVGVDPNAYLQTLTSYIDLNIGVETKILAATVYSEINVGIERKLLASLAYTDLNVVTTETPVPHIWWVRPEMGKEGYVFNIYGHGFGAFQGEFDGQVKLGNFICSVVRWERVAPMAPMTISVEGLPRTTLSTTTVPYVLLSSASHVVQEGDVIEYDMYWETPVSTQIDVLPYFTVSGSANPIGYGSALINDTTGDPWISNQPEAYGAWHHREFVVPAGHYLIGRTLTNFGVAWYGFISPAVPRKGRIRSLGIRRANGAIALWATGDDQVSIPPLTYTANGGTLTSATRSQEPHHIDHGEGIDPDTITPEHGWLVAVVPTGAISSMVRVVLEDD